MQNETIYKLPLVKVIGNRLRANILLVVALVCVAGVAGAQEQAAPDAAAQANNPLANFTAVNVHNYYIGKLTDLDDEDANQTWLRIAKPFTIGESLWIMRVSLPFNSFPVSPTLDTENGLGDVNIFATYLIDTGNLASSSNVMRTAMPRFSCPLRRPQAAAPSWSWTRHGFANCMSRAARSFRVSAVGATARQPCWRRLP